MSKYRNLFEPNEWEWFLRLGKGMSDPEEKRVFHDTVIAKKLENSSYSLFDDFPKADSMQIARDILKTLRAVNEKHHEKSKTWTPKRAKNREMLSRLFGELITQGFHLSEEERKKRNLA